MGKSEVGVSRNWTEKSKLKLHYQKSSRSPSCLNSKVTVFPAALKPILKKIKTKQNTNVFLAFLFQWWQTIWVPSQKHGVGLMPPPFFIPPVSSQVQSPVDPAPFITAESAHLLLAATTWLKQLLSYLVDWSPPDPAYLPSLLSLPICSPQYSQDCIFKMQTDHESSPA